jgi:small subunit ribosomal protein S16
MLAIRMQRTGRKGHAMYRVIVQDSRLTPTSGRVVATLGHFDPHTKSVTLEKEKAALYLNNGAQPSDRVARLLKNEGIKLPSWVRLEEAQSGTIRNPEKLRKNRPAEEAPGENVAEENTSEATAEEAQSEPPAEETQEAEAKTEE